MIVLYIDPGTGSMLFAAIMGIAAALLFFLQRLWMKLKFVLTGGRSKVKDEETYGVVMFNEGARYWTLFKPIVEEFERRQEPAQYWTMDPQDPGLEGDWKYVTPVFIGEGNRGFARLNVMRARVCLATTPGVEVYQWKRSRHVGCYVHVFHMINEGTGYRMFGLDCYDTILLTGAFQEYYIRKVEHLRGIPEKELVVAGVPYLDELLKKHESTPSTQQEGMRTVLLAPSWGTSGILSRFGAEIIDALLATGYHIIIRPHPQTVISEKEILAPLQAKYPETDQLEWNYDADNFNVLNRSDILISDYSGVVYDFAMVFDRPVIYANTSYDPAPYDNAWLPDEKIWRFEMLKRFGVKLEPEEFGRMKEVIDGAIADTSLTEARREVKAIAWENIGHSAEKCVDYCLAKRDALEKAEQDAAH
ncbi:MAG: CDP-glycerol glycerophosphotransferase family protein [Lachnospiraceae bacterium]|jgi:hypothetical protein|nr:CDP-glycerol glycerophosphotransferase family protein [Lachnospiraceae bacterium]